MIHTVTIRHPDDPAEFRQVARKLLGSAIAPSDVAWATATAATLFPEAALPDEKPVSVPRSFATLADAVICHRSDERWSLLYQALWRIDQGERYLMQHRSDPLLHRLRQMAAAIKHDQHRMTAFVRFRKLTDTEGEHYIAWYEPQHFTLRRTSSFFVDRFANMRFSILTPDLTMHWDRAVVQFGPPLRREDAVSKDAVEDWWRRYYASIFNPARINVGLMQGHMPKRFWRNLPEAASIMDLINQAGSRTDNMIRNSTPDVYQPGGAVSANPLF